ncbi:tannase/feruloyl esterase family alpha/beta hydrolase [Roseomonas sp. CCTCC AB2023176]|uniref:tannase/feruloyl esterase family alpha/beta hydrolase n=1 Tax=Roseomonas sp. CCTCC AB2023176 TaxID=3342640 RepID=UPI0035D9C250
MRQALIVTALLAAASLPAASQAPAQAQAQAQADCASLAGRAIPAASIGLPSGGARVTEARAVPAGPSPVQGNAALPAYCQVLGDIAPLDPAVPPIAFQLNIPSEGWNGRAVQYGGGGFNGVLVTGLAQLRESSPDDPHPLARGFATFGTDSGHRNQPGVEIQAFALNEEALENFTHAAYPKVRDAAAEVLRMATGRAPSRVYYYGSSEGGREGLMVAQRYPDRYDGIVSSVPVINWVGLQGFGTRGGQLQRDGGWIPPGLVRVLHDATLRACDGLDGLEDGIIANQPACARAFDVRTLLCGGGSNSDCLTVAQVAFLATHRSPFAYGMPLANGLAEYPGAPIGGEAQPDGMIAWTTGPQAPRFPLPADPATQSRQWYYGNGAIRYFLARDPAYDPARFRVTDFADAARRLSATMDATDPDLSRFAQRGGRLILKEHTADYAQSPAAGTAYWESLRSRLGGGAVDGFARFYLHHGANHTGVATNVATGVALPGYVDLLGALDAWVERGEAPAEPLVQATRDGRATRPLCRYPAFPRYDGQGDVNAAESFACVAP